MSGRARNLTFASIILASVLVGTAVGLWQLQTKEMSGHTEVYTDENPKNHFSVIYRGFLPDSSNDSFPDYYVCVNDLDTDIFEFYTLLEILNQETRGYYFRTELFESNPEWTVSQKNQTSMYTVYVGVDRTVRYWAYLTRAKPSSIPEGRRTESVHIVVKAFNDSDYEEFYSQDDFTVTFHFIDRGAPVWTILSYSNFDDGTTQEWGGEVTTHLYRSYRYSLSPVSWWATKKLYVPNTYSEAYLIYAKYVGSSGPHLLQMNSTTYFYSDISAWDDDLGNPPPSHPYVNADEWYQFANPLWIGQTTFVQIYGSGNYDAIDDVYVIAK